MTQVLHIAVLSTLLIAALLLAAESFLLWNQGRFREALSVICILMGFIGILTRLTELAWHRDFTQVLWPYLLSLWLIAVGSTTLTWFTVFRRKRGRIPSE